MADIDASALRKIASTLEIARATGPLSGTGLKERADNAALATLRTKFADPLLASLDRTLTAFKESLSAVQWPEGGPAWRNARLVVKDAELEDKVRAETVRAGDAVRREKFYSKGVDRNAAHDLEPGEYKLRLTLGDDTDSVSVTVDSDVTTWGELLDATAEAVNASDLHVQAEVLRQTRPGQIHPDLLSTGSMLSLFVDPGRTDQDLAVNSVDKLARALDLDATAQPLAEIPAGRYSLVGFQRALPTTLRSGVFDPGQAATLAPGAYTLAYALGDDSGTASVTVDAGDTWSDVLTKTAAALSSASTFLSAEAYDSDRPVYLDAVYSGEGMAAAVSLVNPKQGVRLTLSDSDAPDAVLGFYDPTSGLPGTYAEESYIASATGNGWTQGRIYTYDAGTETWQEKTPSAGDAYYVTDQDQTYRFDGSAWSETQNLLDVLGLAGSAQPGTDAHMSVNGVEQVSATNSFSAEQGRLALTLDQTFAQDLPLKVIEPMAHMEMTIEDAVNRYNDLRSLLSTNSGLWQEGFAESWRAPVTARARDLHWLGVEESGADKLLWVDGDTFWSALLTDPDRAEALLADQGGLVEAWSQRIDQVRAAGLESALVTPSRFTDSSPPWRRELDNERDLKLVDLLG